MLSLVVCLPGKSEPLDFAFVTGPQENSTLGTSWQKYHACQIWCKSLPQATDEKYTETTTCTPSINYLHTTSGADAPSRTKTACYYQF